jgi:hypothetical protein
MGRPQMEYSFKYFTPKGICFAIIGIIGTLALFIAGFYAFYHHFVPSSFQFGSNVFH